MALRALLLLSLLAFASCEDAADSSVVVLTSSNFDELVNTEDAILVEFYAPWCGHCKSLAPEYEKAAAQLKADGSTILLGKVDATANKDLAERFGIQGFPTLKLFRSGKPSAYDGGRSASGIVSWLLQSTGPAFTAVSGVDELSEITMAAAGGAKGKGGKGKGKRGYPVLVALLQQPTQQQQQAEEEGEEGEYAEQLAAFEAVARAVATSSRVVSVLAPATGPIATSLGTTGPAVVLLPPASAANVPYADTLPAIYDDDVSDAEGLRLFVDGHLLPALLPFSQETASKVFASSIKRHMLIFSDAETEGHDAVLAEAVAAARDTRGQAIFLTVDRSEDPVLQYFDVAPSAFPTARFMFMGSDGDAETGEEGEEMRQYMVDAPLTQQGLTQWIAAYYNGSKTHRKKSEPVPEESAAAAAAAAEASGSPKAAAEASEAAAEVSSAVVKVVGVTYDDVVLNSPGDVLVEFYAPWCTHCKKLLPVFEAVATLLPPGSVTLAKFDATANEHDTVTVKAFPTVLLFKAGDKANPIEFTDRERTVRNLYAFLQKSSTFSPPLSATEEQLLAAEAEAVKGDSDAAAAAAAKAAAPDFDDSAVLDLNASTFHAAIEANKDHGILVEFYAPWCGHCKSLAPHYAAAAKTMASADPPIVLAKIDATVATELAAAEEVEGFPTLKWYQHGRSEEYGGGRTPKQITHWLTRRGQPPAVTPMDQEELAEMITENAVVAVGYYPTTLVAERQALTAVATQQDKGQVVFVTVDDPEIAKQQSAYLGSLVIYARHPAPPTADADGKQQGGEETKFAVHFTGNASNEAEVAAFIAGYEHPLIMDWKTAQERNVFDSAIAVNAFLLTSAAAGAEHDAAVLAVPAAEAHRGSALFITVNEVDGKDVMDYFGLSTEDLPAVRLLGAPPNGEIKTFAMKGALTSKALTQFVSKFFTGELTPNLKSQPVPPVDQDDAVTTVVGRSFDRIVLYSKQDVLIEFYAPWCGHCKQLTPIWAELADSVAHVPSLLVAKMDATANEHEATADVVKGFPTILLYVSGNKEKPIPYEGERSVDGFLQFLHAHAKHPFQEERQ